MRTRRTLPWLWLAATAIVAGGLAHGSETARPQEPREKPPEQTEPRDDRPARTAGGSTIRILPPARPAGGLLAGKVRFEVLTIDPAVTTVELHLDGERAGRARWPRFEAKLALADPPREQIVRAVALDAEDRVLGEDELVVNRLATPFRVRITSIAAAPDGGFEVSAALSTPPGAELDRLAFFVGDRLLAETAGPPFQVRIARSDVEPQAFVRVLAALRDGRSREDVALLEEGVFAERVDVHLVELQVLVTDRTGAAVEGLELEDFEILDGGEVRRPERLYPSHQVELLLGLSIDSSGSMWPLWDETSAAAHHFLDATLRPGDRAFLVDFDSQLRLLQPASGDRDVLARALERLRPHGGTALYDSILFSLLQYEGERGRRALIVLTDGIDSESRSDPHRTIDFGRRLGVPVYIIALRGAGGAPLAPGLRRSSAGMAAAAQAALARNELRVLTDPTGGRLFHVVTAEQVSRAFAEIQRELRRQYVLTYHTDRPPGDESRPEVRVRRKGLEVRSAAPLDLAG